MKICQLCTKDIPDEYKVNLCSKHHLEVMEEEESMKRQVEDTDVVYGYGKKKIPVKG